MEYGRDKLSCKIELHNQTNPARGYEILDYGLRIFRARDKEVRSLKRIHKPSTYGFRIWTSSWLLMDFLRLRRLSGGSRVMDLGCGWGLAGIYCAKKYGADVTGVDMDSQVFPFLRLHAEANGVKIHTLVRRFGEVSSHDLKGMNFLIGSDICFWDTLVNPLIDLIDRAFEEGVQLVLIADPGRGAFIDLGDHFIRKSQGEFIDWSVDSPHHITGRILAIAP